MRSIILAGLLTGAACAAGQPLEWTRSDGPRVHYSELTEVAGGRLLAIQFEGTQASLNISDDGGLTWDHVPVPLTSDAVGLRFAQSESGTIIGKAEDYTYRSRDNGVSWERFTSSPALRLEPIVAVGDAFVGVSGTRAYFSWDDGATWTRGGLPAAGTVRALETDWNGSIWAVSASGVRVSHDVGRTWWPDEEGITGVQFGTRNIARSGDLLYLIGGSPAALYRRTIGSRQWDRMRTLGTPWGLDAAEEGQVIYIGNDGGSVLASTDGGATWRTEMPADDQVYVVVIGAPGWVLVSVRDSGMWRREGVDGPGEWLPAGTPTCRAESMSWIQAGDGLSMRLICQDYWAYASEDSGASWTAVGNHLIHTPDGASALSASGALFQSTRGATYRLMPPATIWTELFADGAAEMVRHPSGAIYGFYEWGWRRTFDDGLTWEEGPVAARPAAAAALSTGRLVVVSHEFVGRVHYSDDGGFTWTQSPAQFSGTRVGPVLVPGSAGELYLTHVDQGLYESLDGGVTWRLMATGNFQALAVGAPGTVVYGRRPPTYPTYQLFYTFDSGATWTDAGEVVPGGEWPVHYVTHLAVRPDNVLVAAVHGAGVYTAPLPPSTGTEPGTTGAISLLVRPNPATTTISVESTGLTDDVVMYDLLGRKVVQHRMTNGRATIDVSRLPPGQYVVRLGTATSLVSIVR